MQAHSYPHCCKCLCAFIQYLQISDFLLKVFVVGKAKQFKFIFNHFMGKVIVCLMLLTEVCSLMDSNKKSSKQIPPFWRREKNYKMMLCQKSKQIGSFIFFSLSIEKIVSYCQRSASLYTFVFVQPSEVTQKLCAFSAS